MKPYVAALHGALLGTAVGDALGLPAEGMTASQIRRRWNGSWQMRFIFGRGMMSDDTEHSLMVAQALISHPVDPTAFQRTFARKLRWWFLGLPAGVGLGTARACVKLWIGYPPQRSGVNSAGNGPAMRSAILGVCFSQEPQLRRRFVSAATQLTHTDPRAELAALAVAECAAWSNRSESPTALIEDLKRLSADPEWQQKMNALSQSLFIQESVGSFATSLGLSRGVTGYALHTVPVAIYACLLHRENFRKAMTEALNCGGDTDTVGAIVGAIMGAWNGASEIPSEWLERFRDWPRGRQHIQQIASRLAQGKDVPQSEVPVFLPFVLIRNVFFLLIVLLHGFRRLVP